jgi:hypothetical protein
MIKIFRFRNSYGSFYGIIESFIVDLEAVLTFEWS